ncbi:MAG: ATP-binding cassette domain-containing protein, partial [Myxococcales bacterium]|nr:ATP-binding cassette domain-containing protein [Myxococcales bacterium]
NGVGKTTLVRMILGIVEPDRGRIRLFDEARRADHGRRIGYLPEERGLYPRVRVDDQLLYFATLKGVPLAEARPRLDEGLALLGLSDWKRRRVRELSKGMTQQVQILAAMLHNPDLLFLDEPFVGLDPINRARVESLIRAAVGEGKTVVLSTHQMDQVESLCDRVLLMNAGRILLDGPVQALKARFRDETVWVGIATEFPELREVASARLEPGPEGRGPLYRVRLREGIRPGSLLGTLVNRGYDVQYFAAAEPRIEEIFVRAVTQDDLRDEPPPVSRAGRPRGLVVRGGVR